MLPGFDPNRSGFAQASFDNAAALQYARIDAPTPTLLSVLGDTQAMLGRAQDVLKLATVIADHLCGGQPRGVSAQNGQPVGAGGGIAQLDHARARVDEAISSIAAELQRIAHAIDPSISI